MSRRMTVKVSEPKAEKGHVEGLPSSLGGKTRVACKDERKI